MAPRNDLQGSIHTIANGRLSYELFRLTADQIWEIAELIRDRFGFVPTREPVGGLDSIWQEFQTSSGHSLTLGWDNWSGIIVMAEEPAADAVVRDIGAYLDEVVPKKEWPGAMEPLAVRPTDTD